MKSQDWHNKHLWMHHPNGGTALVRARAKEHIDPHLCFVDPPRWYLLLFPLVLALFCWRWCHWRCQSTHLRCSYCKCCMRDACSTCHGGCAVFAACFYWSWCSCLGDHGHEFTQSAWCFPFRGSPDFMVAFAALETRQLTHLVRQ